MHGLGDVQTEVIDQTGKTLKEVREAGIQNLDIMKIISELIPAFTTSIIGLVGASGASIYAKWEFANEDAETDNDLNNISPEEYIRDIAINTKEMTSNKSYLNRNNELLVSLIDLHKEERITENTMTNSMRILVIRVRFLKSLSKALLSVWMKSLSRCTALYNSRY